MEAGAWHLLDVGVDRPLVAAGIREVWERLVRLGGWRGMVQGLAGGLNLIVIHQRQVGKGGRERQSACLCLVAV